MYEKALSYDNIHEQESYMNIVAAAPFPSFSLVASMLWHVMSLSENEKFRSRFLTVLLSLPRRHNSRIILARATSNP